MITKIKLNENMILSYRNGVLFCVEKPLYNEYILFEDYVTFWYKNNKLHRDNDLPSAIYHDGRKEWYKHGKLHREQLPAVIYSNGRESYFKEGKLYIKKEDGLLSSLVPADTFNEKLYDVR